MPDIAKISGTAIGSIAKVSGTTKANVAKFSGIDKPSSGFSNAKSLSTDGVNDFFKITLSSNIVNTNTGSISIWAQRATDEDGTCRYYTLFNATDGGNGERLELFNFRVFNSPANSALIFNYRREVSGTATNHVLDAKTGSSHHGKPYTRASIPSNYGDFGSSSAHVYNVENSEGEWHHVVCTWDTSETYTHSGRTYTGSMKMYFDGTLVNHGASTLPSHNRTGSNTSISGGFSGGTIIDTIKVGVRHNDGSPMDALFDEFAIFNSVLSASDVSNIYNSGAPGDLSSYSNLVGWWRFEGNTDDSSSNSNSGTLTNGATYSSTTPS